MRCRSSESSGSGQTIVSEFECVLVCVCVQAPVVHLMILQLLFYCRRRPNMKQKLKLFRKLRQRSDNGTRLRAHTFLVYGRMGRQKKWPELLQRPFIQ